MNKKVLGVVLLGLVILALTLYAASLYPQGSNNWSFLNSPLPGGFPTAAIATESPLLTPSPESASPSLSPISSPVATSTPLPLTSIEANQKDADYYLKQSQEEYKSGNKEEAIRILEEGLKVYPDNELIKSRLDILKKNSFFGF